MDFNFRTDACGAELYMKRHEKNTLHTYVDVFFFFVLSRELRYTYIHIFVFGNPIIRKLNRNEPEMEKTGEYQNVARQRKT